MEIQFVPWKPGENWPVRLPKAFAHEQHFNECSSHALSYHTDILRAVGRQNRWKDESWLCLGSVTELVEGWTMTSISLSTPVQLMHLNKKAKTYIRSASNTSIDAQTMVWDTSVLWGIKGRNEIISLRAHSSISSMIFVHDVLKLPIVSGLQAVSII